MENQVIQCKICLMPFEKVHAFTNHLRFVEKITSREYYDRYIKQESEEICYCGKIKKFDSVLKGYLKYCTPKCAARDPNLKEAKRETLIRTTGFDNPQKNPKTKEKTKKTNNVMYGGNSPFSSQEVQDKSKETCMINWGVDHPQRSRVIREKTEETCKDVYGVSCTFRCSKSIEKLKDFCDMNRVINVSQIDVVKQKKIETTRKNYGVDNCSQSDIVKQRKIETSRDNWNTDYPVQCKIVMDRVKKTMIERYGVESPMQSPEILEKLKRHNLTECGFEYLFQSPEIQEKIRQRNLEKYGVEYVFQSEIIQEKIRQTNLERYGFIHPIQSSEVQKKQKESMIDSCGYEYALQSPEVQERMKKTNSGRYGVDYYVESDEFQNDRIQKMFNRLLNSDRLKRKCTPNFQTSDYVDAGTKYSWTCSHCNSIFDDSLDNGKIPRCPVCYPVTKYKSLYETEVSFFCKQYYPNLIENDRSILKDIRREIDVYIPEEKIGIEFDGMYWHSELFGKKYPDYHKEKTLECRKQGIQLIHIFEDEWVDKQEIVKSILKSKLKKIDNIIYARNCTILEVSDGDAFSFLYDNHLQGPISGFHLGLYYDEKLVSLITVGKPRFASEYELEILRFCTVLNTTVTGGFSRLLSHISEIKKIKNIMSYVDIRYGTGNSYKQSGFQLVRETEPGYFYLDPNTLFRRSRMQFQKKLLKGKLPSFDPELTEWENMQLNGYDRIWDCGHLVFSKEF